MTRSRREPVGIPVPAGRGRARTTVVPRAGEGWAPGREACVRRASAAPHAALHLRLADHHAT
ncbi:hypothetical protein ACFU7X_40340, partial [Streptomyces chartreusis]|uniref:hypothetical protein n=1 Tax=Streptomyces chartreusis TaxID=1969 RepID=UPI0036C5A8FD